VVVYYVVVVFGVVGVVGIDFVEVWVGYLMFGFIEEDIYWCFGEGVVDIYFVGDGVYDVFDGVFICVCYYVEYVCGLVVVWC